MVHMAKIKFVKSMKYSNNLNLNSLDFRVVAHNLEEVPWYLFLTVCLTD